MNVYIYMTVHEKTMQEVKANLVPKVIEGDNRQFSLFIMDR